MVNDSLPECMTPAAFWAATHGRWSFSGDVTNALTTVPDAVCMGELETIKYIVPLVGKKINYWLPSSTFLPGKTLKGI